ncbi:MAG: hypothetical protein KDD44_03755, partial [Bdellovibrionales bacterium]|nr:hypothetical protein [Bdellovibrionales bacterium]
AEMKGSGLQIHIPETIRDVNKEEVPFVVKTFGGHAVVKVPYGNAGQGVFIITNQTELARFQESDFGYSRYIVQSLIGNYEWSSQGKLGRFYHTGTVPNRRNEIYVADLRMMVGAGPNGFRPFAVYGRRARMPLLSRLDSEVDSWDMLGTNLSVKLGENQWDTESERLLLMDRKDFNSLGVGLDELIAAFIQTSMAIVAVDKMATSLFTQKGRFRMKAFRSINADEPLIHEIETGNRDEATCSQEEGAS